MWTCVYCSGPDGSAGVGLCADLSCPGSGNAIPVHPVELAKRRTQKREREADRVIAARAESQVRVVWNEATEGGAQTLEVPESDLFTLQRFLHLNGVFEYRVERVYDALDEAS